MKFKRDVENEIVSILGEGVEFQGDLAFSQGIRVDGVVRGKIRSESFLLVGPKGRIEAEVVIRRISIHGEFHGVIRATDRVEIHKDGKVYGDIFTPCLIIEAGALFEGKCNMNDQRVPKSPVASGSETGGESRAGS